MDGFEFELGGSVSVAVSGESGTVKARAQYEDGENNYYVLYKAADGRAVKQWWKESELIAGPSAKLD